MMTHDAVTLISREIITDEIGQKIRSDTETAVTVMCLCDGIKRTEWDTAYQNGYQAEIMLKVFHADYSGQTECDFHGKRYSIYRTYPDGEYLELYLGTKVGVTNG